MCSLEWQLELLHLLAELGYDWNHNRRRVHSCLCSSAIDHWHLVCGAWASYSFGTSQDWILQSSTEYHVQCLINDKLAFFYCRIGISDALHDHGFLVFGVKNFAEHELGEQVAPCNRHWRLKHHDKVFLVVRRQSENERLLQCAVDRVLDRPTVVLSL